ncbi:ImmA/IrrE family metallo-endopeptidase [Neisseria sp.]
MKSIFIIKYISEIEYNFIIIKERTIPIMSRTASYWDRVESEANDFAARLLMPENFILSEGNKVIEKFKKIYNQDLIPQDYFISEMAQIFNVSVQAMTYRLKNLDII